ncbi:MAG: hypothetical protein JSV16_15125, partial [Candidatus Hydrogenedentota bacterium]
MRKKILIVLLIPLFSVVSTADASAATITLRDHANVVSALVSLSDVATVSGTEPPEELEALRSIVICSAPLPAETQILGLTTIVSALRASSADLSRLKLMGPAQVVVRRKHALVSVEELSSAFSEHVSRKTGWPQDSFMVRAPKNLRAIPVPVGSRVIIVETFPDENYCGSVLAHFQVLVDGKLHCKLSPRFVIERYVEALVAVRKLSRGQPVKASDVEITKVEQSLIEEESFTGKEQAAGLVAIRT